MKVAVVLLFLSICFASVAQGLNAELGFNDDYSQNAKGIIAFDNHSLFVKEQTQSASFFTSSSLLKIDTSGNQIWELSIAPQAAEVVVISELIASENDGAYVLGYARPSCDVSGGCFWFLQKVSPNGLTEWTKTWSDQVCFGTNMSGLSQAQNDELFIHYNDPLNSYIFTIGTNGSDLDTIQPNQSGYRGIDQLSGFHAVAYKQFSLYGFDSNGTTIATRTFSSFISEAQVWNDSLFVITNDSLFVFDNSLQPLASTTIPGFANFKQLKVRDADIRCVSATSSEVSLFELNRNLQVTQTETISTAGMEDQPLDFTDEHLSIAADFPLAEYVTIRHLDYSLIDPQDASVNRTDIGIVDIQITQANLTPNPNFNAVFQVEIGAEVLLKNFGPNVLESCRMNHYISPALACGLIYYGEEFFNLNLAPGDSVWVPLGTIHTNERSFPNDSLIQDICIYTSHPNSVTDLVVENDRSCTTVTFGMAQLIEMDSSEKELTKVVDLLGRELRETANQWVIRIYSDGSTEKIFQVID